MTTKEKHFEMSFYDKVEAGYYDVDVVLPIAPKRVCKKCGSSVSKNRNELLKFCRECGADTSENELDIENYQKRKKEYIDKKIGKSNQFGEDLFAEHEVTHHPNRHKCYHLAWNAGHDSGYSSVANYFIDFVELLKVGDSSWFVLADVPPIFCTLKRVETFKLRQSEAHALAEELRGSGYVNIRVGYVFSGD